MSVSEWRSTSGYDVIVDKSYAPWVAYPNPNGICIGEDCCFAGTRLVPTKDMTPELWERALGLVICGLATRYRSLWVAKYDV